VALAMDGSTPVLEPECIQDQMIRISNAISSIDKEIVALGERIRELKQRVYF
jgi:hypothetical protein